MKTFGTLLGVVFGLALLAALLAGGYFLFKYVVNVFGTLGLQVETIAAIASVVALICAAIIASGLKAHKQKENGSTPDVEKANLYQRLLFLWGEHLKSEAGGKEWVADGELNTIERLLALHGGPKFIADYVNLRRSEKLEGNSDDKFPGFLNKLVLEMRTDLGRTAMNLKEDDLLDLLQGRF